MGIANDMPDVTFMAFTPITSPSRLISGPPELPNYKTIKIFANY